MNDPRHPQPLTPRPLQPHAPQPLHPQPIHPQPHHPQPHGPAHIPAMPARPIVHDELEPIGLDDDVIVSDGALTSDDPLVANAAAALKAGAPKKITTFGVATGGGQSAHQWKRTPHVTGQGICRVRSFHGRLSDQGLEYLDTTINEWLDAHPEIEVKTVTTNTDMFDGKVKELTLIVNIWY